MNVYLLELQLDGFIADAKARWLPTVHDNQCAGGGPGDPTAACWDGNGRRRGGEGRRSGLARRNGDEEIEEVGGDDWY